MAVVESAAHTLEAIAWKPALSATRAECGRGCWAQVDREVRQSGESAARQGVRFGWWAVLQARWKVEVRRQVPVLVGRDREWRSRLRLGFQGLQTTAQFSRQRAVACDGRTGEHVRLASYLPSMWRRRWRGRYGVQVEDEAVGSLHARSTRVSSIFRTRTSPAGTTPKESATGARALAEIERERHTQLCLSVHAKALLARFSVFQCKIAPCFPRGRIL